MLWTGSPRGVGFPTCDVFFHIAFCHIVRAGIPPTRPRNRNCFVRRRRAKYQAAVTTETRSSWHFRNCVPRTVGIVAIVAAISITAVGGVRYVQWRAEMIEWDFGSIHEAFGGSPDEDRLLEIVFLREWEYLALKPTSDGSGVWLHVKLSKRHCGNLMLVDPQQRDLIRPFELRYPEGLVHRRGAVSCIGEPIADEPGR